MCKCVSHSVTSQLFSIFWWFRPCKKYIFSGCFFFNKRHKAVAKLWSRHNQSLSNLSLRSHQVIKLLPCSRKASMKQSTSFQQEHHINNFLEGIFSSIFTPFKSLSLKVKWKVSILGAKKGTKKKETGARLFWIWGLKKEKAPWKRKLAEGCPCAEVVLDQLVEHSLCNTGPRSHQHVLQKQNQWEKIYS